MIDEVENPGKEMFSPAKRIGTAMRDYMQKHEDFYLFSPDETTSNKLDAVYDFGARAWGLPQEDWDLPEAANGRIVEMLSENTLFACMVGYLMNGEPAMMTSYESFFMIIASQILQHMKFLQQSAEVEWRKDIPAANLLSTSTCWRQDHNGFTHQSPALISLLLSIPSGRANCLFPVDDVTAEACFIYMTKSQNVVNLTTFNKIELPRWLNSHQADEEFSNGGVKIFDFVSDEEPDYVLVGAGDIVSREAIKAMEILREDLPERRLRFVNILALSHNAIGTTERKLSKEKFEEVFTKDKPIIANFHGYPDALRQILGCYTDLKRVNVHGFCEHGSTTTPFEMLSVNQASHYDLAIEVAQKEGRGDLVKKYQEILQKNRQFAQENGVDEVVVD